MITLLKSLQAWNDKPEQTHANFKSVFRNEVEQLDGHLLPLQAALRYSSYALADGFKVMVMGIQETSTTLEVKTGLFYNGMIAGCSCADDPTPLNEQAEFCECLFTIDKLSAQTDVQLIEA